MNRFELPEVFTSGFISFFPFFCNGNSCSPWSLRLVYLKAFYCITHDGQTTIAFHKYLLLWNFSPGGGLGCLFKYKKTFVWSLGWYKSKLGQFYIPETTRRNTHTHAHRCHGCIRLAEWKFLCTSSILFFFLRAAVVALWRGKNVKPVEEIN